VEQARERDVGSADDTARTLELRPTTDPFDRAVMATTLRAGRVSPDSGRKALLAIYGEAPRRALEARDPRTAPWPNSPPGVPCRGLDGRASGANGNDVTRIAEASRK
jgi:hypothetical protein